MNRQPFGVQHVTVVFLDACYAFENHHYGAPFRAHIDGFKGGIKY